MFSQENKEENNYKFIAASVSLFVAAGEKDYKY